MSARVKSAKPRKSKAPVPRMGVTPEKILDVAAALVDDGGDAALSLAAIAKQLGVQTPSLYAHMKGLDDVKAGLQARGVRLLREVMQQAAVGRARGDALYAMCNAMRDMAKKHPGLFGASMRVGASPSTAVAAEARALLDVVLAVVRGYGVDGNEALHATRALRAATYGFIQLELAGGFGMPLQVNESWRRLLEVLDRGIAHPRA